MRPSQRSLRSSRPREARAAAFVATPNPGAAALAAAAGVAAVAVAAGSRSAFVCAASSEPLRGAEAAAFGLAKRACDAHQACQKKTNFIFCNIYKSKIKEREKKQ